ncbi:prolyl oligopeptidase family serine peptidase [Aurantimonas sp. 22II-16-19i]|uniref:prolyl oligopeptidase family serine peptidase n=1 Tax=Aurantimonas sp. 22II-16-19i TaxID=1317114 RepID=UPI0009F7AD70|nr:prolyl oligopeptidase family serine peptidase [Aurantimonas sp. 22II-16-19i]ORE85791.1 prolyl oligopeptidase [Aurantimonas sp. 22II-16-19i]
MIYPETTRIDAVDGRFGTSIADPYRWLEGDIRHDPEVADWVDAQDRLSASYLAELPGRCVFHERLKRLFDHERLSTPEKRGRRYFFTRNSGLDKQPVLIVRDGTSGRDRVVIDPNAWSEDGSMALAEWAPSEDGTRLAFAIQENGADWRTIRVLDVDTGTILDDEIKWARFLTIAWAKDGSGFFYARNPEPGDGARFQSPVLGHAIYFHWLGMPQSDDRLVHGPQTEIPAIHTVDVTADGRYAVIYSTALTGGNALALVDLEDPAWTTRQIVASFDHGWTLAGNVGTKLFLWTQKGAERGKIVTTDIADPEPIFTDLVAERQDAVLRLAGLVGDRLILAYMVDAKTRVERLKLDGTPDGVVALPGIGTTGPFHGRPGDDEAFFVFTSHDAPTSIYRYDVAADTSTVWAEPKAAIDLTRIVVEQRFYGSKDGTRVPIFLVRRRDVTGPAPTMLTAYGGFGIPMVPFYSPAAMAWVEQGGVYAVANIRGGGEYGRAWHDGGRGQAKQNGFDDVIAAAEFLKAEKITSADGLAIHGESNGGLMVGAVVNQRPDLFAAALPGVGVMDMLRFDRFTGGQLWTQEFGSPDVEADFRNLLSYSPLHNIGTGVPYPAILVSTADTDDRVVPGHSFKYAAALQAADLGPRPRILRVDRKAGHGSGKAMDKAIAEIADMWAFAAKWTGLKVASSD